MTYDLWQIILDFFRKNDSGEYVSSQGEDRIIATDRVPFFE
jgi:hypothetical protein